MKKLWCQNAEEKNNNKSPVNWELIMYTAYFQNVFNDFELLFKSDFTFPEKNVLALLQYLQVLFMC